METEYCWEVRLLRCCGGRWSEELPQKCVIDLSHSRSHNGDITGGGGVRS